LTAQERAGDGREELLRDGGETLVEGGEAFGLARFARRVREGGRGARRVFVVDEDSAARIRGVGCVRGVAATAQIDVEAEVVDDLLRKHADQVRIAGEAG